MRRSQRLWAAAVLASSSFGCIGGGQRGPDPGKKDVVSTAEEVVRDDARDRQITYAELDELTRAYADRYLTLANMAGDALERDNPSIRQRRDAHHARLTSVSSIYDIATNRDPFTRLLDMLIVVTLQSQVVIDDATADEYYGDRAQQVVIPLRRAREDIWQLAARVLTPEQLQTLDFMIWEWRRAHPDVHDVAYVRFDDFGASRSKTMVAAAASGGGLLAPLRESMQTVDELKELAERAFFISKRAPLLATWSSKAMLYDALVQPETQQVLNDYHDMSQAAKSAAAAFGALPDRIAAERESVQRMLDEGAGNAGRLLADYRAAVADTTELVGSVSELFRSGERIVVELKNTSEALTGTVSAVDRTLARYKPAPAEAAGGRPAPGEAAKAPPAPGEAAEVRPSPGEAGKAPPAPAEAAEVRPSRAPAKGFDIAEYTRAAEELTRTVTELNRLVQSTSGLLEAKEWTTRIAEIDALGGRQLDKSRFVIDSAQRALTWVVVVLIGGLLLHAAFWHFLRRRAIASMTGRERGAR